jgi:hypothetical protein
VKIFEIYHEIKTDTLFLFDYQPMTGRLRGNSPKDCRAYNFKYFSAGADDYRLV